MADKPEKKDEPKPEPTTTSACGILHFGCPRGDNNRCGKSFHGRDEPHICQACGQQF